MARSSHCAWLNAKSRRLAVALRDGAQPARARALLGEEQVAGAAGAQDATLAQAATWLCCSATASPHISHASPGRGRSRGCITRRSTPNGSSRRARLRHRRSDLRRRLGPATSARAAVRAAHPDLQQLRRLRLDHPFDFDAAPLRVPLRARPVRPPCAPSRPSRRSRRSCPRAAACATPASSTPRYSIPPACEPRYGRTRSRACWMRVSTSSGCNPCSSSRLPTSSSSASRRTICSPSGRGGDQLDDPLEPFAVELGKRGDELLGAFGYQRDRRSTQLVQQRFDASGQLPYVGARPSQYGLTAMVGECT